MKFTHIVLLNELKQVELSQIRDKLREPQNNVPSSSNSSNTDSDEPWVTDEWKNDPMEQVRGLLIEKGWVPTGKSSFYSSVFKNPNSPFIIKILQEGQEMRNPFTRCALQWLRYSNKNYESNIYLPRVYYIQTIQEPVPNGLTRYIAVMETLEEYSDNAILDYDLHNESDVIETALLYVNMFSPGLAEKVVGVSFDKWITTTGLLDSVLDVEDFAIDELIDIVNNYLSQHTNHPLYKAFSVMNAIIDRNGCRNDLHHENLMYRSRTGNIVLTDPLPG